MIDINRFLCVRRQFLKPFNCVQANELLLVQK